MTFLNNVGTRIDTILHLYSIFKSIAIVSREKRQAQIQVNKRNKRKKTERIKL